MQHPNRPVVNPAGLTLWFTGLPCSGKSTLAGSVADEFVRSNRSVEVLDADLIRATLCKGLGFSRVDRDENVARLGWVCAMLNKHNVTALVAAVSPYRAARNRLRDTIPGFIEIFVRAPLDVCIRRDVKGMYAKALAGGIRNFTGIDDPYEEPFCPHIVVDTDVACVADCVSSIIASLKQRGLLVQGTSRNDTFPSVFTNTVPG